MRGLSVVTNEHVHRYFLLASNVVGEVDVVIDPNTHLTVGASAHPDPADIFNWINPVASYSANN